jgi:hypothetical protein
MHGAGRNVATTPCGPSPAQPGSREQGPAARKSRKRAVATVLVAQGHRGRAAGIQRVPTVTWPATFRTAGC